MSAAVARLGAIEAIPPTIRERIGNDHQHMCLALIDGPSGRYCLVLDPDWVAFAFELDERPGDLIGNAGLPRPAIRAVIHGWDHDVALEDASVRWSDDLIPHVGFPDHLPAS